MRRMILRGCNGRMGQVLSRLCADRSDIMIAAGIDVVVEKRFAFPVYADPMEFAGRADVLVDFASPDGFDPLLDWCLRKETPLLVCATGHSPEQLIRMEAASRDIPLFRSGNMSLGVHLLIDLVGRAAKILGEDFDVEIVEKHHNQKLDAPSGTALMLYDAAASALPYTPEPVYDRHAVRRKRGRQEIGLHSLRGGTIVGEHEVVFAGRDEVITLSHSANSREAFATGAIRAALFLASVGKPGLYGMKDLLG